MYCVLRQQTSQPSHVTKRNRNKLWKPRTIDKKGEFTKKPAKPRHFFFVDVHILALLLFFLQLVYSVFFVELKSVSHYHGHKAHHINKKKKGSLQAKTYIYIFFFSSFQLLFFFPFSLKFIACVACSIRIFFSSYNFS